MQYFTFLDLFKVWPALHLTQEILQLQWPSTEMIYLPKMPQVLQQLMEGLISLTFKPEDLQCSFFRYTVRELLACAVIRPVLNLACPR